MATGVTLSERYELRTRLGVGGAGAVWRAYDLTLQREVAIKLIALDGPGLGVDIEGPISRFRREARAVAALNHPNIVAAYDFGVHDDVAFLVMELVEGASLAEHLRRRRQAGLGGFDEAQIIHLARQVCAGLAVAHRARLVHRDMKPSNLMVADADGRVKIVDFGIARIEEQSRLTRTGSYLGTLPYVAPEQMDAEPIDGRADLYSLACVLFELMTCRSPYDAKSPMQWMSAHQKGTPFPLRRFAPAASAEMESLLLRMMSKNPTYRPPDADAVSEALAQIGTRLTLRGSAPVRPTYGPPPPPAVSRGVAVAPRPAPGRSPVVGGAGRDLPHRDPGARLTGAPTDGPASGSVYASAGLVAAAAPGTTADPPEADATAPVPDDEVSVVFATGDIAALGEPDASPADADDEPAAHGPVVIPAQAPPRDGPAPARPAADPPDDERSAGYAEPGVAPGPEPARNGVPLHVAAAFPRAVTAPRDPASPPSPRDPAGRRSARDAERGEASGYFNPREGSAGDGSTHRDTRTNGSPRPRPAPGGRPAGDGGNAPEPADAARSAGIASGTDATSGSVDEVSAPSDADIASGAGPIPGSAEAAPGPPDASPGSAGVTPGSADFAPRSAGVTPGSAGGPPGSGDTKPAPSDSAPAAATRASSGGPRHPDHLADPPGTGPASTDPASTGQAGTAGPTDLEIASDVAGPTVPLLRSKGYPRPGGTSVVPRQAGPHGQSATSARHARPSAPNPPVVPISPTMRRGSRPPSGTPYPSNGLPVVTGGQRTPSRARRIGQSVAIVAVVVAAIVLIATVVAALGHPRRGPRDVVTPPPSPLVAPAVGQCYPSGWAEAVDRDAASVWSAGDGGSPVGCAVTHSFEVVAMASLTGAAGTTGVPPVATSAAVRDAYAGCAAKADDYLGGPWRGAYAWLGVAVPDPAAWARGARWLACVLRPTANWQGVGISTMGTLRDGLRGARPAAITCFSAKSGKPSDCDAPHTDEVVGLSVLPPGKWPGTSGPHGTDRRYGDSCELVAAHFLGFATTKAWTSPALGWSWWSPSQEQWELGNRTAVCTVSTQRPGGIVGSVRGLRNGTPRS